MAQHVVVGSGPIGSKVASLLADQGESVRVVTRSGRGPEHPLIERVAADAADARRLTELTAGAEVLYNCANPKYTEWEKLWFPMNNAMLAAATAAGAVYAITGNLYGYGPQPGGRMTESTPLAATGRKGRIRNRMWQDALTSGVRTVEVRGSDYVGAGTAGVFSAALLPAIQKGRAAWAPANVDLPHSFTYTGDMARALVTLARDNRSYGKGWHVPSPAPVTIRQMAARYCELTGQPQLKIHIVPRFVMRTAGLVVPIARELAEMDYQFYAPFVMDSSLTERTFGLTATDLDVALRETADAAEETAARTM
ncbi:putative NAD-dependent epimerase/dehydratase [Actinoplanes missouriensis 431]|uniref:Putative NAD-dependent epimerase/dehydratase n=1 Tax=Actinoplanes missouriensis (strain ATCC 14538 / DSM 43046 / CBS 188.64 / JCM 3121 / NBRC 102363 / NCIMB 12654 / NRRL B-3342 / UNCC 431) TaxID=512565 RepID=I0GYD5_ACTM4|nr:NAD-dependent epimerase/dehydratase family protein [Actinoplanes missouriensis]BAL85772.1 putative NAD-dependent epimerase/dehydratase [Actinoplanes missouriensis 431]